MNKKKLVFAFGLISAISLVACGESGTTEQITNNNYTTGMDIVAGVSDLPKCSADNEGDRVWVKEKSSASICVGGKWESFSASGATASDYGCETEPLADGSGVNILCDGEVIGTVLNGKDGSDGAAGGQGVQGVVGEKGETGTQGIQGEKGDKGDMGDAGTNGKPGSDCKVIAQAKSVVTVQCGDDKFSMNLNGSGEIITPVEDEEISIEIPELNGVSQKGPFIMGTEVKGYELEGTRAFAQTGRSFTGRITTNDGKFRINSVKLVSSQVLLSATGYYRDEVSGDQSKSPITLYAITDLTDRSNVNVNLLTHLEYDRVAKMMKNSDGSLKIKTAKKDAQKEIFAAFGIDASGFGYSEDLDIFGTDDQSAALLAISILMQGDRSVAELSGLLASFSKDIEDNGKWDDAATRAKIADWAYRTSLGLNGKSLDTITLAKLNDNVSKWGLGTVPAFEKYIRNFWATEYGVGECNADSRDEQKPLSSANSVSYKSKTLICDKIRSKNSGYFKDYEWREAIGIETDHVHACNSDRNKLEKYAKDGYWYECDASENTWSLTTEVKMLNQEKPGTKVGEYIDGSDETRFNGNSTADSVYEWTGSSWTLTDNVGWYTHRFKDKAKTEGQFEPSKTLLETGVVYEGGKWRDATTAETNLTESCNAADRNKFNSVKNANAYVCDTVNGNSSKFDWRDANKIEKMTRESCTSARENVEINKTIGDETYNFVCKSAKWTGTGKVAYEGQNYNTVIIGDQYWFAENLNYDPDDLTDMSWLAWSGCYNDDPKNCETYGRLYTWEVAMNNADCASGNICSPSGVQQGICPDGWHLPTSDEFDSMLSVTGKKIRANSWLSKDDVFGFSLLPAGYHNYGNVFLYLGSEAYLWSSSEINGSYARYLSVYDSDAGVNSNGVKERAFSVRCLKNN